jgi:phosphoglycolate phosphatase
MPVKHIIWDWNGTLFDDAWLCLEGINVLLKKNNIAELTEEKYKEYFTFPVEDYYHSAGFDLNSVSFEELGTEFMEYYKSNILNCSLRKNAREVLNLILERGMTQSILSAYKHTWLEQIVSTFSLNSMFTGLLGCDDYYAYGKVENGLKWIEHLDCKPEDVIMVGDTIHDVEVASAMGTRAILINGGNQSLQRLKTCNVPIINDLTELIDYL